MNLSSVWCVPFFSAVLFQVWWWDRLSWKSSATVCSSFSHYVPYISYFSLQSDGYMRQFTCLNTLKPCFDSLLPDHCRPYFVHPCVRWIFSVHYCQVLTAEPGIDSTSTERHTTQSTKQMWLAINKHRWCSHITQNTQILLLINLCVIFDHHASWLWRWEMQRRSD